MKSFITGAIFGIVASFFGIFIGLQISPMLGSILTFSFIIISKIIDMPFGEWSLFLKLIGFLFSMVLWGLIFFGINKILQTIKK